MENGNILCRLAVRFFSRYMNQPAQPWEKWDDFLDTVERMVIVDSGDNEGRDWCTCYKTKDHKRQKQDACVHILGVRLLTNGHLGRFQLEELMPFAPKSRGKPRYSPDMNL